jgi:hypothetical protein
VTVKTRELPSFVARSLHGDHGLGVDAHPHPALIRFTAITGQRAYALGPFTTLTGRR